jgi:hypothetical protein
MKRSDLEHILRASKGVTGETDFIVIGSQAILGAFPDAPRAIRESMEVDLYPKDRPELAAQIEGSLVKMVRRGRLRKLIEAVEDPTLRERLAGALAMCESRCAG